tara:strand:+ start:328 stop:708 length:381 start_codon:yes stop_codon:yes gene_type:complete
VAFGGEAVSCFNVPCKRSGRLFCCGCPGSLRQPADLGRHELLQVNVPQRQNDWQRWLQVAGVSGLKLEHANRFDYSYLAIQAAIEGLGVAVTNRPFVSMDLAAGRLVAPFDIAAPAPHSYYPIFPR